MVANKFKVYFFTVSLNRDYSFITLPCWQICWQSQCVFGRKVCDETAAEVIEKLPGVPSLSVRSKRHRNHNCPFNTPVKIIAEITVLHTPSVQDGMS